MSSPFILAPMQILRSLDEANKVSAVKLCEKRQKAKVGDLFRLSPETGIYLWGRLIRKDRFFGVDANLNLVYIYDAISMEKPDTKLLKPSNLLIPPIVVNNLGWSRGYWQIMISGPLSPRDFLPNHRFVRYVGTGSTDDYVIVDEYGKPVRNRLFAKRDDPKKLSQSGISNFNHVDWLIRQTLQQRGVIGPE